MNLPREMSREPLPRDWWLRAAHDLRGPITPMRMAVQLLRSGMIPPGEQGDALVLIERQIDQLLGSIDDLNDLLRLNCGAIMDLGVVELGSVLDILGGRSSLRRVLEARRQTLELSQPDSPLSACCDPARLGSLLEFLLTRTSQHAPEATLIALELTYGGGRANWRISGATDSLQVDPAIRLLAGHADDIHQFDARPILMREIARMSRITFESFGAATGIVFSMPAQSAGNCLP